MATTSARLASIDVKGGLWGADLLAALADDRNSLPDGTVTAESYGLPGRASTEQAARAAWTVLTAAWEEFTEHHQHRIATFETSNYGADSFTWDKWTRHLLDQLGYDPQPTPVGGLTVDNPDPDDPADTFPIAYTHHDQTPIHAVPAGAPLDGRSPGVKGAARQSPHSMVQHYLNRTSRHLWGLVTNGITLRLLRDNAALSRQAYIEFDLAGIFDEGAYADFALLWHAAHATRFAHDREQPPSSCIAETWQDHATKTGVAALEDLREGVEAAIAEIGQGLIEHPDNRALREALADPADSFDATAFYRQLLYIAYRHVFWFALDDRDLLHPPGADRTRVTTYRDHYASTVLRSKARSHRGARHPDGWQHFQTVATWFADPVGRPELSVPGLLGRLWDPQATSHINGTTLNNRRYYEALRRLGYVQRDGVLHRINYDAMGSEELGAVYESLLEIRPVADPTSRTFTPDRTHGSDRKKTGSYYTPTSLIKVLLDEALDPVLDDRIKQAVHELPPTATPDEHQTAQEAAILGTTICDPAMGSAHFLVAAGMRVAKRLAAIRTDEIEPAPGAVQQAFRDVASRCLYGVDVNPMAVELAKVALWLECHVPGQPLTFLDHHLKHGNALLGVGFETDLIAWDRDAEKASDQGGVPDAAFKALTGDDKAHARLLRDRNKKRRSRGSSLRFRSAGVHRDELDRLAASARELADLADNTPDALAAKQEAWSAYEHDAELERQRLRADAWTVSWTITKSPAVTDPLTSDDPLADDELPWDVYYDTFFDDRLRADRAGVQAVLQEASRHALFHWYVEFPDIASTGGFGCMLGNPPWERLTPSEQEWFAAAGVKEVATAKRASARRKRISALRESDDPVDQQLMLDFDSYLRQVAVTSEFARMSGRYERVWARDLNLYALFALNFRDFASGRAGMVVPTSAVTDYGMKDFFAGLVDKRRIVAAYDFINKGKRFFPEVHASFRFATLILSRPGDSQQARFAFMLHDPEELAGSDRAYTLTAAQIALVNPNTKTAPVFLTQRDAEITTKAYERHPVLVEHAREDGNPWGVTFMRMFDMANDSGLFRTSGELSAEGWQLTGNMYVRGGDRMMPLYEAKMFHHFNHRWATYTDDSTSREVATSELRDPGFEPLPRYWVPESEVRAREVGEGWFGWRKITNAGNMRQLVCAALPDVGFGDSVLLCKVGRPGDELLLEASAASFALDFVARQKLAGTNFNYYLMEQLPFPTPDALEVEVEWSSGGATLRDWILHRAAALTATSGSMANLLGYERAVQWDEGQRELWRTELDAAMFHLYGYQRNDVAYAMDTFPIVARKDRKAEGLEDDDPDWRTKRLILAKYDEFARHAKTGTNYESFDPPPPLPERLRDTANAEAH